MDVTALVAWCVLVLLCNEECGACVCWVCVLCGVVGGLCDNFILCSLSAVSVCNVSNAS